MSISTNITFNGVSYAVPAQGESNWGTNVSNYLIAIASGALQKTGGTFTLTADVDFGASYGLKAMKFSSRSTPSTTGIVRLGNNESVAWRNAANSADLAFKVNASNVLEFNGNPMLTLALGTANYILKMNSGGTAYEWGELADANIAAAAAIARSKIAAGTADHVLINSGAGAMSSEATLSKSRGGAGADMSSVTFPSSGTVAVKDSQGFTTYINLENQAEARFSEQSGNGTNYIGFKAPDAVTANKVFKFPDGDGSANQVLGTNGSLQLQWQTVATDALSQYNVKVGDSGNTAAQVNTNLLGTIAAIYSTATATMTIATPAVVTQTAHGLTTGDRVYFTTTGALPTGLSVSTAYYIKKIDANTFNISTTVANLLASTYVASSGSQSGTHTVYKGGFSAVGGNWRGRYDGTTIDSGYIGQLIEPSSALVSYTITTSEADVTNASIALTPGVWQIFYSVTVEIATGATSGNSSYARVMVTNASNTHIGKTERILQAKATAAVSNVIDASLSASCVVNISTTTTYKLRAIRVDGAGTGSASIYVSSGSYDSTFYAVRIA